MRSNLETPRSPLALKLAAGCSLLFLHVPLCIIILYAFTTEEAAFTSPPPGLTTHWFCHLANQGDFGQSL